MTNHLTNQPTDRQIVLLVKSAPWRLKSTFQRPNCWNQLPYNERSKWWDCNVVMCSMRAINQTLVTTLAESFTHNKNDARHLLPFHSVENCLWNRNYKMKFIVAKYLSSSVTSTARVFSTKAEVVMSVSLLVCLSFACFRSWLQLELLGLCPNIHVAWTPSQQAAIEF